MINTRWFISYRIYSFRVVEHVIITDVSPARWLMYDSESRDERCVILYAEEISPSLAAELIHAAGLKAYYFKEVE